VFERAITAAPRRQPLAACGCARALDVLVEGALVERRLNGRDSALGLARIDSPVVREVRGLGYSAASKSTSLGKRARGGMRLLARGLLTGIPTTRVRVAPPW